MELPSSSGIQKAHSINRHSVDIYRMTLRPVTSIVSRWYSFSQREMVNFIKVYFAPLWIPLDESAPSICTTKPMSTLRVVIFDQTSLFQVPRTPWVEVTSPFHNHARGQTTVRTALKCPSTVFQPAHLNRLRSWRTQDIYLRGGEAFTKKNHLVPQRFVKYNVNTGWKWTKAAGENKSKIKGKLQWAKLAFQLHGKTLQCPSK